MATSSIPGLAHADPHRSLFAFRPAADHWKIRSWPRGLGLAEDAGETGLGVGFAWPASASHLASLLARGRTGFAEVYDRAGACGAALAELVTLVQELAPGRPVDVLAHSLGARVALAALPHLGRAPGRMILLGAAEFDARALEHLARRARAVAAAGLQRDSARQRPLRRRLRGLRAAAGLGRARDRARGSAPICRTGSTCSSTAPRSRPG